MPRKKKKAKKKKTVKKAVKKPEPKEEVFYVGIKEPIELKDSLLESAKDLMQYLERFDELKKIREEKKVQMDHLRNIINDITKDTNKLKRYLPKTKLRIHIHEEEKPKKAKKTAVKKTVPKKKIAPAPRKEAKPEEHEVSDEELAKLEEELSAIEGRLTKLT